MDFSGEGDESTGGGDEKPEGDKGSEGTPDTDLPQDYLEQTGGYPITDYAPPSTDDERSNQSERDAYWDARRDANEGAYPWDFYADRDNLTDLGRGLVNLATPTAYKVAAALFSGKLPSADPDQTPAGVDIPEGQAYEPDYRFLQVARHSGPRMPRVAAEAPQAADKPTTTSAATSDQPKRAATGTPKAGVMANIKTTPYGILGDAPVTRKILMGA
jgi:hypothetical protein